MVDDPAIARRIDACQALIRSRALIGQALGFALCPCPTLDMLLDLCLAELEQRPIYLWSLCMAANVPFSTAYRKVTELEGKGLAQRTIDEDDHRRTRLCLTDEGHARMMFLLDQNATCLPTFRNEPQKQGSLAPIWAL